MYIRGLAAALNASGKFKYKPPEQAVDHLVIGGGVVGLAITEMLSKIYPNKSTYLIERHSRAGEEISSRNSEVIHAGLYYPPESLKTRLCIRGRQLLYQRCLYHNIPHKQTGKLIVAYKGQRGYLDRMAKKINSLSYSGCYEAPPLRLLNGTEARELQPDLSPDIAYALYSPETGIVDSHALLENLEKIIGESESGVLAYSTRAVRVDPFASNRIPAEKAPDGTLEGWVVQTVTSSAVAEDSEQEGYSILARVLINASGLNANLVLNSLLPTYRAIPMYYARGSYASYRGPGVKNISTLIYPVPPAAGDNNADSFKFQSLGTHLTLDMSGGVRFGPDIEWISPPSPTKDTADQVVSDANSIDFWVHHLAAKEDVAKLSAMHRAITAYLPSVTLEGLRPDYVGIRPKLGGPSGGFQDFQLRIDRPKDFGGSGSAPMISLLGIESPGLTASLALAELVAETLK